MTQLELFDKNLGKTPVFPSTRYQGSKSKISSWIISCISKIEYDTILDAFGGTGAISYAAKLEGKQVTYNDVMKWNYFVGLSIIQNKNRLLSPSMTDKLLSEKRGKYYSAFIYDTFHDVYFTDDENKWLDLVISKIRDIKDIYCQSIAYFALFQSCIVKRPYNLFHRKNLYVRLADVERNFGNKATWDTPFAVHFKKYIAEANNAVFDNSRENRSLCCDAIEVPGNYDLVYIDTPYTSQSGVGVDYLDFYHFLEGITLYDEWSNLIEYKSKHLRLERKKEVSQWADSHKMKSLFKQLFERYSESILAISYRTDGIPSIDELLGILKKYKSSVDVQTIPYKYVLSKNRKSQECLILAK